MDTLQSMRLNLFYERKVTSGKNQLCMNIVTFTS